MIVGKCSLSPSASSPDAPTISVLTSTWQRAGYLERVWRGLEAQSYGSFEWIIGNDGSTDDTVRVIEALAARSSFRIVLVDADIHVGKARIDNEMIRVASGDLCLKCDSDDVLDPCALASIADAWMAIPQHQQPDFLGVSALAEADGKVLGLLHPSGKNQDLPFGTLQKLIRADFTFAVRTELVRNEPFLEVDLHIPEQSVWCHFGSLKTRFVSRILKHVEYRQAHAISYSGMMRYYRGRAHAYAIYQNLPFRHRGSLMELIRRPLNFVRYCIHGDIAAREATRLWGGAIASRLVLLSCIVPAFILAWNDKRRGVVEKTHIEFDRARSKANVSTRTLSR